MEPNPSFGQIDNGNARLPTVSVIIASYNHAQYVEAAIRSVLGQDYPHLDLLVVDDGSSDDSVERIARLQAELGFDFHAQQNKGLSRTLNEAIARAKGSLIVPFGSDDIMLPGRIAAQAAFMDAHPETGICGGNVEFMNADGTPLPNREQKQRDVPMQHIDFDDVFLDRKPVPPAATLMFRREALDVVGGFNPDIRLEDLYIWLRITRAGYFIDRLPLLMARYRKHPSNTYKNLRFMVDNVLRTYDLFGDHPQYKVMRMRYLISTFLKSSNRDKILARELLTQIPFRVWDKKVWKGLMRYYLSSTCTLVKSFFDVLRNFRSNSFR